LEGNSILENGPRIQTQQPLEAGPRAGIRVEYALPALSLNSANGISTVETEFPALRAHGNIVVAPSGPALAVLAIGYVCVTDNELTCGALDSVPAQSPWPLDRLRSIFGGATVFVFNLGLLSELSAANVDYSNLAQHQAGMAAGQQADTSPDFVSGDILFQSNRVMLNFPDSQQATIYTNVTLFGLADTSMQSNQLIARTGNHPLITNAFAVGVSVRLEGNRCQDRFDPGFSGVSVGFLNATTDNQGSRCFLAMGVATLLVNTGNRSWLDMVVKGACEELKTAAGEQYIAAGYVAQDQQG
jgi:hypothetical protein